MNAPAGTRLDQALVDQARAAPLAALVARRVKLRPAGRGWSGLCPFHDERTPSFTVSDEKGFYHCFGCGAHGDAIEWLVETERLDFRAAVLALTGGALPDARRPMIAAQRSSTGSGPANFDCVSSATAGRWIYQTSGPARGELVERWLEARGLDPRAEFLPGVAPIDALRFHPRCPVSAWRVHDDPGCARLTAPAMIAPIRDVDGAIWGVHVTFLSGDGRSKARLPVAGGRERPTRKMFGKVAGHAVCLSGDCGSPGQQPTPGARPPLIVGEGIETAWAFAQGFGRPCRVIATLSLQNLQGNAVKLHGGALPLWNLRCDPDAGQPFTIPEAGEVIILVDADMKPLRRQRVQLARGAKPVVADIDGLKRAEICAALAAQAWRRAGANKVSVMRPRMGLDFNDAVLAA